jgi:hypothetical protein
MIFINRLKLQQPNQLMTQESATNRQLSDEVSDNPVAILTKELDKLWKKELERLDVMMLLHSERTNNILQDNGMRREIQPIRDRPFGKLSQKSN